MLSYRHAFHAGNFADVLKHLVLVNTLAYLGRKPGPLLYVDTHAGAGEYSLGDRMARRTGEAEAGILKLDLEAIAARLPEDAQAALALYRKALAPWLARRAYPGSPALAAALLRPQDRLHLYELHSADFPALARRFHDDRRARCEQADGFHSAKSLLPPAGRRAVVLVDPPYERKEDFRRAADYLRTAWKRMPTATLLLWYPILAERQDETLVRALAQSDIRDLWRFELGISPTPWGTGMTACGILAVNPPWILPDQLSALFPALAHALAGDEGRWRVDRLTGE